MEKDEKKSKKTLVIMVLLLLLLVGTVGGVTYSAFMYSKAGYKTNQISSSSIMFAYDETTNGINLENAMPIADEVGMKLERDEKTSGYFDFNVSYSSSAERSVNYEIYATVVDSKNLLPYKYVKVYLTDQNDNPVFTDKPVKTFADLSKSLVDENSKQLYYGSFTKEGNKKFRLRLWVSEDYPVTEEAKSFKIKVNVNAYES